MKLLLLNLYTNGCNRLQKIFHSKTEKNPIILCSYTAFLPLLYPLNQPSDLSCDLLVRSWPLGWEPLLSQTKGIQHVSLRVWHHHVTLAHPSVHSSPSVFSTKKNCGCSTVDWGQEGWESFIQEAGMLWWENVWKQRVQWWTKKYISRCAGMWSLW